MNEQLDGPGAVKATMLQAHLGWAEKQRPGAAGELRERLGAEFGRYLAGALLATEWVPFRAFVEIDRAIAALVGGDEREVWRRLGHHSAEVNLGGVYKAFVKAEPHRFFNRMTLLHGRFQSFGRPVYEETGERSGTIRIEECGQYSPVYCASALGYYEGALEMMKVPGPLRAAETSCQCAGDAVCLYQLAW